MHTIKYIFVRLKNWLLVILVTTFGLTSAARAALTCAPDAIHELNRQDQKLCIAGVEKLDALLNVRYKAATQKPGSEERRALLRKEQRIWLQARNRCESTACFVEAYEQRIQHLENFVGQEHGNASASSAIALSYIRQLVEGSMIGFVRANEGQTVPDVFLAPDGRPDMVFLPKIKGQQDSDLKMVGEGQRTLETFFGKKRFKATLLTNIVNGNFHILAIRLPDAIEWSVKSFFSYPRPTPSDERVDIGPSTADLGPELETFNNYCDPPGDSGVRVTWKTKGISLDKQVVVRLPWREFPCQGPREEPSIDSHWRRFIGSAPLMMGDLRDGAFVFIWIKPVWPQHSGIQVTPMSEVTYLLHLDSRRRYSQVEMLTPEVMLLDSAWMKPFRERVNADFDKHNKKVNSCRNVVLDRRPSKRKLIVEEVAAQNKELANCNTWLESPEFSEAQFIQTFVPEQWKNLWAN